MPKSVMLRTLPSTMLPMGKRSSMVFQGLGSASFMDSEMRLRSTSRSFTTASTVWLTVRNLDGFRIFRVHDISDTWISPSTPSSSSMKAP